MPNEYLMYAAIGCYLCCYIPELYANYINKNANIYNLPEKILLLLGTIFAFSYAVELGNISILTNYSLLLFIDIVAIVMRGYYVILNYKKQLTIVNVTEQTYNNEPNLSVEELDNKTIESYRLPV